MAYASNRSFGVFLVHVLVLYFVLGMSGHGLDSWVITTLPQPLGTAVVYLATLAGSLLLVEVLRRLPGSVYLTGRERLPLPRLRKAANNPTDEPATATPSTAVRGA